MDNSEFLENKSPIENLKLIQSDLDDIEAEHLEKRRKLENKYQKKFQPFYTKRYQIVNYGFKLMIKSSNESADQGIDKPAQGRGVPNFWLTALKANEVVAEMIQKHDEDALRYLKDIKWYRIKVSKDKYPQTKATDFKLDFFFARNPYFKNSVLSKTYCIVDEDNDIMEKAIGTEIEWYPRKCLTNKVLSKSKSSIGMIRTTLDSFFNFFKPLEMPDDDDDEMVESVTSLMQPDYNVGVSLREDIIPHAVFWFTDGISDNESGVNIGNLTNSHKNAKVKKLSPIVLRNVELLEKIQSKHDVLEEMFFDERRDLEGKYLELCQPLYRKRYEIVNGIKPADQGEIKSGEEKGLPNFWLTALKANKFVAKLIQKQDEEVLKYLKDIRWCIATRGFKLEFDFSQNPYFKNSLLRKSYFFIGEYCPAPSPEETIGTEIEWLVEGRSPAADSFFNFFAVPKLPDGKDSEKFEEWTSLIRLDYLIGLRIWKDIIPHAVSLFTISEFENCIEDDDEFGDNNYITDSDSGVYVGDTCSNSGVYVGDTCSNSGVYVGDTCSKIASRMMMDLETTTEVIK